VLASADVDPARQTALLDMRFLAGDGALFAGFQERLSARVPTWREGMVERARPDNLLRWRKHGESVFLLEPHVKEGKGGLRDVHGVLWLARVLGGLRGDIDLLLSGLLEPSAWRGLVTGWDFLLRVRCELHTLTGRPQDKLLFEHQEPVARALGFRKARGLLAVEHFMGAYYRNAYAVAHGAGLAARRLLGFHWDEEGEDEGGGGARGLLGPSAGRRIERASRTSHAGPFESTDGEVVCLDPAWLDGDPQRLLALFAFLQESRGRLHHDTEELVRTASQRIPQSRRADAGAGASFRAILEGQDVFRVLLAMHRSGFLGRYMPEWGAVFCQAQHNRMHLYTVDVHSLYAVRELEALGREAGLAAGEAFARAHPKGPLILAALLHDIAKRHGAAHSRVGAEMVPRIFERLGYGADATERTAWLVRHHLLLSDMAYHRDLYDPATAAAFEAVIPSVELLDDLLALSWADARATNPEMFSSWKRSLVDEAFRVARAVLDGRDPTPLGDDAALRARIEASLLSEVGRKRAPELADRLFACPVRGQPGFLHRHDADSLALFAVLIDRVVAGEVVATHVRHAEGRGASEWIVCTRDRPGLFALLAGTLAASSLSIVAASAATRDDGIAVDTFFVTDVTGRPALDERRWKRVSATLLAALQDAASLGSAIDRARASFPQPKRPGAEALARIELLPEASARATVVEVVLPDRPGLLYAIAAVLRDEGVDLVHALIATRHDLASDTFYVVGADGKPLPAARARALLGALRARLGPRAA
jgi:[protein-PII] uridylyltransferase